MWRGIDKLPEAVSERMRDFYDRIEGRRNLTILNLRQRRNRQMTLCAQLFQCPLLLSAHRLDSPAEVLFCAAGALPFF